MKSVDCDIIRDLLPGYSDKILSEASNKLVREHLQTCDNCLKEYKEMNKEIPEEIIKNQDEQIDYLKEVRKKMSKKNKFIIIIGIILLVIVILNISFFIINNNLAGHMLIYLDKNIAQEEVKNIEKVIKEIDKDAITTYHSKEDAFNEFKEKMKGKNKENFLDGYNENNNPLSSYYEIKIDSGKATQVQDKLINVQGVKFIKCKTIFDMFTK